MSPSSNTIFKFWFFFFSSLKKIKAIHRAFSRTSKSKNAIKRQRIETKQSYQVTTTP